MGPRWIILCALLASPDAVAQPVPGDQKAGPRLLTAMSRTTRSATPMKLVTVWDTPPEQRTGPCVGRVCVEAWPQNDLATLLSSPGLVSADLPARFRPRLDVAGPLVGAPQTRARTGLTGAGVLVVIIDTGLDWTHPDFIDEQGLTRVAWLLDQSHPPTGLHPELEQLGQGAVFRADEIQAALESGGPPVEDAGLDAIGHGTHVAGIAAGDDPVYTGVAPGARLVVVKSIDADLTGFSEDRVLAGLAFARAVAEREGQPMVINLSLGNQLGAHDGSEPVELALQSLAAALQPPCAITVAAGNESQLAIHARAAVGLAGPPLTLDFLIPQTAQPSPVRPAQVLIDLWAEGDSRFTVVLQAPSGWRSDPVSPRSVGYSQTSWSPDGLMDISAPAAPHPINGLARVTFTLRGEAGLPLSQGTWTIRVSGQARRIDVWIGDWDLAGGPVPRFLSRVDPAQLVGPPATARGIIAVGAMNARTTWPSADGTEYGLTDATTGQLAAFSALGPTRDGRLKPELVAPGQSVASSMSAQASAHSTSSIFYTGGSARKVMPDGLHAVATGTSMASPFAAGACALAFEREPDLSGPELLGRLQVSCLADEQTGYGLFDPGWGFGKLSTEGLLAAPNSGNTLADRQLSLCGSARSWLPVDERQLAQIASIPRDGNGRSLGPDHQVDIDAPGARFTGPVIDHGTGLYTRALTGSGQRGTRFRLACDVDGQRAVSRPEVVLAGTQEEASTGAVRGGAFGCSPVGLGPRPAAALAWIFVLVGIGWFRRSGSRSSSQKSTRCRPNRRSKG